ncbi:MAG: hypothetical protein U0414_19465 [Polyangiaceae bacterium]
MMGRPLLSRDAGCLVGVLAAAALAAACGASDLSKPRPVPPPTTSPTIATSAPVATAPAMESVVPDDLSPLGPGPDIPPKATLRLALTTASAPLDGAWVPHVCAVPGAAFVCGLEQLVVVRSGRAARDLDLERGLPHDASGALVGRVQTVVGRWPGSAWLVLDRLAYRWTSDGWVVGDVHVDGRAGLAPWNHALAFGDDTGVAVASTGMPPPVPHSALGRPSAVAAIHHEAGNTLVIAGAGPDHFQSVERWIPGATHAHVDPVIRFGSITALIPTHDGELFIAGLVYGAEEQAVLVRAQDDRWVDVDLPPLAHSIDTYARSGRSEWLLGEVGSATGVWARLAGEPWTEVTTYKSLVPPSLGRFVGVESMSLEEGTLWITLRILVAGCARAEGCDGSFAIVRTGDVGPVQSLPL